MKKLNKYVLTYTSENGKESHTEIVEAAKSKIDAIKKATIHVNKTVQFTNSVHYVSAKKINH